MAYKKTTWVDNSAPSINADNLNKIEQGIEDAHGLTDSNLVVGATATGSPGIDPGWETSSENMTSPDVYIKIKVGETEYVIPAWAIGA